MKNMSQVDYCVEISDTGFENFKSFMKGQITMKFAIRLVLLTILALALSVALVSAQEEEMAPEGALIQAGETFTLEDMGDETYTLTVSGVAATTPLIFGDATGGFVTADLLVDWLATGTAAPVELRFQFGDPASVLYDYTVSANAIPAGEFEDGTVVYTLTDVEVTYFELGGTAPDAAEVLEGDKPDLEAVAEAGEYIYVALYVGVDADFIAAISQARLDRLMGARPSSIGGSCIPNVTC